ncbi:MAG: hypothetical protein M3Q03_11620 [Chloroflexota bacterium]|nr:hypothetical protein [Chloroflexota bacterium]
MTEFSGTQTARGFETYARDYFSGLWGVELQTSIVEVGGSVPKSFDFVSADRRIVGDAKWYSMRGNGGVPQAKLSVIAEYVWLLQKVEAEHRFLVFGHDPSVAELFLHRYRALRSPVEFYFLDGSGHRVL